MSRSITVSKTVEVDVDVDVDVDIDEFDDEDLAEELRSRGFYVQATDFEDQRINQLIVESAYRAARDMGEACPRPIRDLLWKIHGMAIA